MGAILFAQPLTSPPSPDHDNRILWVSRVDGAPGPSILDLSQAGCCHLALKWDHNTDTLDLAYLAP